MTAPALRFRLRPRHRGVAGVAIGVGGGLAITGAIAAVTAAVVAGAAGVVLGAAYLASPTWRLAVVVDDDALAVVAGTTPRFRLPWGEVVRVLAAPATRTCFVDGGAPARSLIVPGPGAPAPYAIDDAPALYAAILARVDPAKVQEVADLAPARRR